MFVGDQTAGIGPDALQLFTQKAAHVFIADAGQHAGFQPLNGGAVGHVAGRAAEVFGECAGVFQTRADLLSIEIDGDAPETNDIKLFFLCSHTRFLLFKQNSGGGPSVAPCRKHGNSMGNENFNFNME